MSNVRDRTGEFAATIDSLLNRSVAGVGNLSDPLLGVRSPSIPKSPSHVHTEFTRRATEINVGIQRVLSMLEKLTKLARNKTLFDDRPVEVQDLTQIIKVEIAKLNGQIADLQNFQRMRKTGGYTVGTNRSAEEHSSQVVVSLQSRLAEASSTFTNVLEMRSQNIKAQRDRRDQFSATNIMPEMPTQSLQQLSLMTSAPDTSYLESRGAALQGIESTINELGTIYRQLATMIAEQGEVRTRGIAKISS
ncbi:hypothetical protein PSACC_01955 [Paramicrosporidium saccamoebae]|uniref:t-SNARE coiled-coil homology domain-containing protein n=1 Tax=Paramicrosporidium saccamoebae TaxID=1246581 RepID=A0A2H9TKJ0_9FUNG|nr:hypothetical protein PSACC_01955 [Paramicrosporidium saccamoebae]